MSTGYKGSIASRAFAQAGAWPINPEIPKRRIPEPTPCLWTIKTWPHPVDNSFVNACKHLQKAERDSTEVDKVILHDVLEQLHATLEKEWVENSYLAQEKEKTQKELARIWKS